MSEIFEYLKGLETLLHFGKDRSEMDNLSKLIHPEFLEIGYSGKAYDYETVIKNLQADDPSDIEIWSQSYSFTVYAADIIQINYVSANMDSSGGLSRHAQRTSIWVLTNEHWQLKYHQATPTAEFAKANA